MGYYTLWSQSLTCIYSIAVDTNPQYRLEVKAQHNATVWILLSRHITEKASTQTLIYSLAL